jgi:hypothetical protein
MQTLAVAFVVLRKSRPFRQASAFSSCIFTFVWRFYIGLL